MQNLNYIRWKCRRGMLELDLLLERFLETHYEKLSLEDQKIFEELLELPDPVLYAYTMHTELPRKKTWQRFVKQYF